MARPPKPAALHLARGNPSRIKAAVLAAEPVPEQELTADHHHTARLTPNQRLLFAELVRAMPPGVLKSTDVAAALFYAIHLDTALEAAERFKADTLVIRGHDGGYRVNPFLGVFRRASVDCMAMATELGATPIARARLRGTGIAPGADPIGAASDAAWQKFTGSMG